MVVVVLLVVLVLAVVVVVVAVVPGVASGKHFFLSLKKSKKVPIFWSITHLFRTRDGMDKIMSDS